MEGLMELMRCLHSNEIKEVSYTLESWGLPSIEILETRLDNLKLAQKTGMLVYDWLIKQCGIMLSDPNYIELISKEERDALLSYNSRLTNGPWDNDKDDLMFSRLRKRYQEFSSKKTSTYTS
jgi:hypothetical protein